MISDYGFEEVSTRTTQRSAFMSKDLLKVYVNISRSKTIELFLQPKDTVKNLKRKIEREEGTPLDKQILRFEGTLL